MDQWQITPWAEHVLFAIRYLYFSSLNITLYYLPFDWCIPIRARCEIVRDSGPRLDDLELSI
jgi:hypothetical protein